MEGTRKWEKAIFSTILWAIMAILLCALPCNALDITTDVTVDQYSSQINVAVCVKPGGTLNLLNGGVINGNIVVENLGTFNLNGGKATVGFNAGPGSVVNITGGVIGGVVSVSGDETYGDASVTVYGPKFEYVTDGTLNILPPPIDEAIKGLLKVRSEDETEVLFSLYIYSTAIEIHLRAMAIPVNIDIKPGCSPNTINLGSNGVIPVAILSSEDFDATTVDPSTVALAGAGVALRGKGTNYLSTERVVNGDGLIDLEVKVETENLDPGIEQDGFATLTGETFEGVQFEGSDEITIVPPQ